MLRKHIHRLFLVATTLFASSAAFGQIEFQLHARQLPGWDPRAREGQCQIRLWVDNRAEIRLRGDSIFVKTLEGAKSRDEGSECSQPMPFNSVSDFQIRQTAGRSRVAVEEQPGRMNNFTATMAVDDRQGGGDSYAFEVSWKADANITTAPDAFFDDVRACQEMVRQRFQSQNDRGSYIDFNASAARAGQDQRRGNGYGRGQSQNRGEESISGSGNARARYEARDISYSCLVDTRQSQVLSATYQYSGGSLRGNDQQNGNRPLR